MWIQKKRHNIFLESHLTESGHHLGQKKTVNRIQRRYYWLGVVKDVIDWIKVCETCQNAEYHKYPCKKFKPVKVDYPWEVLGVTFHGPFPPSSQDSTYVIMVTDFFTKWTEAMAVSRNDAASVAKVLSSVYYRFGASKTIYCNQSWDFCEEVSRLLCERWNIPQTVTDSCEHNGLDDQSYDVLKSSIGRAVNDHAVDWDKYLDPILFQFRTTINPVTKCTPFFLMFNRNAQACSTNEVEESNGHVVVYPMNGDLAQYISADQEERESVRHMVLSNVSSTEKPVRKTVQKCQKSPLSADFQREEEVFRGVTVQSFKKFKPHHAVSFKFQTVFAPDVVVVEKDN